jgi:hypothetical protein
MVIIINAQWTIQAVQVEFNKIFPYLKLNFFLKTYKSSSDLLNRIVSPRKTIEECSPKQYNGVLTITPGMTVSDLEKSFSEYYGLGTLVLRKSGRIWLETTYTNDWTLCRQNKEGEIITRDLEIENENQKKKL